MSLRRNGGYIMKNIVIAAIALGSFAVLAGEKAAEKPAAAPSFTITALKDQKWQPLDPKNAGGPQIAVVWGDPTKGPHALLLKLPAGFKSGVHAHTADYASIVVQGAPTHGNTEADAKPQAVGTTWTQTGKQMHFNSCTGKEDCILFVSNAGVFDFIPQAPPAAAVKK
jgi:hypothetical protein